MDSTGAIRLRGVSLVGSFALVGVVVGYSAITHTRAAVLLALLPVGLFLFLRPVIGVAVSIGMLPVLRQALGSEGASVVVSFSDAVLLVSVAGLVPLLLVRAEWHPRLRHVKPVIPFVAPYLAWLLVVLAAHLGTHTAFKTMTALELTVLPMFLGAVLMDRRAAEASLYLFLIAASGLAVIWVAGGNGSFAGNKNAAGQYLALGIIIAVVLAEGRFRGYLPVPLLLVGLLFAASRGAIVAVAFGAIALLGLRGLGSWRRTATAVVLLSSIILVGYNAVPATVQQRVLAIFTAKASASGASNQSDIDSSTAYNLHVREEYKHDAYDLIAAHPLLGVGTGNYAAGSGDHFTVDPHNFILRAAAEGGVADAATFLFMIGGTGLLLVRRLGKNPWAGPAIAVQVASFTHGLVDVYFIRGIPVLGWFLVGMALNPLLDRRIE